MTKYMMPPQTFRTAAEASAMTPCHFPSTMILSQYIVYVNRILQKVGFYLQLRQILQKHQPTVCIVWKDGLKFGYIFFSYLF